MAVPNSLLRNCEKHDADAGPVPRRELVEGNRDNVLNEIQLGRACVAIDILIMSGQSPEHAASLVTRQLASSNIKIPGERTDPRSWHRLLDLRSQLRHGSRNKHEDARKAYTNFKNEVNAVVANKRVQFAMDWIF